MTIDKFVDRFNSKKVWLVKRSNCGHYWLSCEVAGIVVSGWQRVSLKWVLNVVAGEL